MANLGLLVLLAMMAPCDASATEGDLKAVMQRVAEQMRIKYNMSIAAAFHSKNQNVSVAAGYTDAGLGMGTPTRKALADDLYVWGSTTKMFTGPAVLQLVEKGLVSLDDPISKHVDPILMQLNGTRLEDHYGKKIHSVTIQQVLHMTSGISDYDDDAFSYAQFKDRPKPFGPVEIIGKYSPSKFEFSPGTEQDYCSTNYIMLGLVLANHWHNGPTGSWEAFDQFSVIPEALQKDFPLSKFIMKGACDGFTPVHGFMASYEGTTIPSQDVTNISCLGGWTAGNYVGAVSDVARFTYLLYNKENPQIVSKASQAHMINFTAPGGGGSNSFKFYGMGTFSLDWAVGDAEGYGHVGDTYGYQSQTTYFPGTDFALTVATNIESNTQAQPADFTCVAYHELVAAMKGVPAPNCSFHVPEHFIGKCTCHYPNETLLV